MELKAAANWQSNCSEGRKIGYLHGHPDHKGYAKKIYPRKTPILSGVFTSQGREDFCHEIWM